MKELFDNSLKLTGIVGGLILFSVLLCFLLSTSEPSKIEINEPEQEFEVEWFNIESNQYVDLPFKVSGRAHDLITLTTILPEISTDDMTMMLFSCNSEIEVFINNYSIYSFGKMRNTLSSRMIGDYRCIIPLEKSYSGQKLTVVYSPSISYNGYIPDIYFRSYSSQLIDLGIHNYFYLLTVTTLGVLIVISLVLCFYHKKNQIGRNGSLFINFALFAFASQLWIITNSDLVQFLTNFTELASLICYLSISFAAVPCIGILYELLPRYRKVFLILQHTAMAVVVLEIIGYISALLLPSSLIVFIELYYLLCGIVIFICFIQRIFENKYKMTFIDIGGIILVILGVLSIIVGNTRSSTNWNVFLFSVSVIVFSITLFMTVVSATTKALKATTIDNVVDEESYVDELTKVANKKAFFRQIELLKKQPPATSVILVVAKLTNLREINEKLGNLEGDMTLQLTAKCIGVAFSGNGIIYRLHTNEFIVLFIESGKSPSALKERLLNVIAVNNTTCPTRIELSVGVAEGEIGQDPDAALFDILDAARSTS